MKDKKPDWEKEFKELKRRYEKRLRAMKDLDELEEEAIRKEQRQELIKKVEEMKEEHFDVSSEEEEEMLFEKNFQVIGYNQACDDFIKILEE